MRPDLTNLAALPTEIAPDGNPVAVYLVLPASDEVDLICRALTPRSSVLELGCGAGRISRGLAAHGHCVVGVDQSAAMLRHVGPPPDIRPVLADIETLVLEERFDAVLLASYLVNNASRDLRGSFLATCQRHLTAGGVVVVQCLDPHVTWTIGASSSYGPVHVKLLAAAPREHFMEARLEYRVGPCTFEQEICVEILDEAALEAALAAAELKLDHWLDGAHTWAVARAR